MSRPAQPLEPRIWAKIDRGAENACWLWLGATNRKHLGYGQIWVNGKNSRVTREIWTAQFGEIPTGYLVLHTCDNSLCCNPGHLRLGTHQDNMDDRTTRGRGKSGRGTVTQQQKEAMQWATWNDIVPFHDISRLTNTSIGSSHRIVIKS